MVLTEQGIGDVFTEANVDELRQKTGYNPRKRVATAFRLLLVTVEAFLSGKTLGFAPIRAAFLRRFGPIRPRAFQLRFKCKEAVEFFRSALSHLVTTVNAWAGLSLEGVLSDFDDVVVFDATGQSVPPRGRRKRRLRGCTPGKAGAKWLVGYSLKTGIACDALGDAETASELPLWRRLGKPLRRNLLYLGDLAYFSRDWFREAIQAEAFLLMRLKTSAKVFVTQAVAGKSTHVLARPRDIFAYLSQLPHRAGTVADLEVLWGRGKKAIKLRAVALYVNRKVGFRIYLTNVPRERLAAKDVCEGYRLRWLIELLFREWKQSADLGRSATADVHALHALTYGALIGHAVVRSLRIAASLRSGEALDCLRPLATLHVAAFFARDIIDALEHYDYPAWSELLARITQVLLDAAYEPRPSRSRPRIAKNLGAVGG